MARLEPENNTDLIVRAFERTRTDRKLFIVGGATYGSRYLKALKSDTSDLRVVFAGPIFDKLRLTELMCQSFAYVHGHMVGGTNPILLKALGCGTRILVVNVPFNREVVGDAGLPFPLDVDGACTVFQGLVDDPAISAACRLRTRDRIREAFTWERAADRYEELCRRLIQSQSGDR